MIAIEEIKIEKMQVRRKKRRRRERIPEIDRRIISFFALKDLGAEVTILSRIIEINLELFF